MIFPNGKYLFGILFLAFLISSCQKNVDQKTTDTDTDTTTVFPGSGSSRLLSKYLEVDPSLLAGHDTILVKTFEYDNLERVSAWGYTTKNNPSPAYADSARLENYYQGTDTLPNMTRVFIKAGSQLTNEWSYLNYINGIVNRDSTLTYNAVTNQFVVGRLVNFTFSGTTVFVKESFISSPALPVTQISIDSVLRTIQNGNIVVQYDTSRNASGNQIIPEPYIEANYDNHPNPLYKTSFYYPIIITEPHQHQQRNNLTKYSGGLAPGLISTKRKYEYTYRSDGYPLKVIITDMVTGRVTRGFFVYRP